MVTVEEKRLMELLREKWDNRDFVLTVTQYGRNKNRTDDFIEFIETHPEADSDDIFEYAFLATVKEE